MKKITLLIAFFTVIVINAQSTINVTTSGGSFAGEKWVNITTGINDSGTQVWGQGDGTYGNGAGLINQDIVLAPGTYYVNCFDNYADGWDGTLISVTAYGSVLGDNGGVSPDDGTDTDATGGVFDDRVAELEASFEIIVPNPPACGGPTNIIASPVDTSVDISWNPPGAGTPTGYNWEIQPDGVAQGTPGEIASGTTAATTVNSGVVLTASTSYEFYIQTDCGIDGLSTYATIGFTTNAVPAPSNDDASGATALTATVAFEDGPLGGQTNAGATASEFADPTIPAPGCASYNGGDVWYSVVVPADGNITLEADADPTGSGGDGGGAVYSGSPGSLVLIECDDDDGLGLYPQIVVSDPLLANQTIYFRVWEFGGNADLSSFRVAAYSATLSNDEFIAESNFSFYPNPVTNTLNLEAQKSIEMVTMYNMLGQTVLTATPNTVSSEIDMSALHVGAYFVKVSIDGVTKTVRIIKQ